MSYSSLPESATSEAALPNEAKPSPSPSPSSSAGTVIVKEEATYGHHVLFGRGVTRGVTRTRMVRS